MEKTQHKIAPLCANCVNSEMQRFGTDTKIVCVRDPPKVIGAFIPQQGPAGKVDFNYVYETVYPQPPIPCRRHEFKTQGPNL